MARVCAETSLNFLANFLVLIPSLRWRRLRGGCARRRPGRRRSRATTRAHLYPKRVCATCATLARDWQGRERSRKKGPSNGRLSDKRHHAKRTWQQNEGRQRPKGIAHGRASSGQKGLRTGAPGAPKLGQQKEGGGRQKEIMSRDKRIMQRPGTKRRTNNGVALPGLRRVLTH